MDANLNRIFATAIALQSSRTSYREQAGLDKTTEGIEFAKALAEATVGGCTPEAIIDEVSKAMGDNADMALGLLQSVEEITKAHVASYAREHQGKVSQVHAYESARQRAMRATSDAQAQTLHSQRFNSPEAHDNAATSHEEAKRSHAEAHGQVPADAQELARDHAVLREQHAQQADYHRKQAGGMRSTEHASKKSEAADSASELASRSSMNDVAPDRHIAAARLHQEAAKMNPGVGHEEKAEGHEAMAAAHGAFKSAMESPARHKARHEALDASGKALQASLTAHKTGKPEDHAQAAEAHAKALTQHLDIHGTDEEDGNGPHGKAFDQHHRAMTYHLKHAPEAVAKSTHEHYAGDYASAKKAAQEATTKASVATYAARKAGFAPKESSAASGAHQEAVEKHMEAGRAAFPNKDAAKIHWMAAAHHGSAAMRGGRLDFDHQDGIAKAETPAEGGHDLAKQEGEDAMKIEGRPDEKNPEHEASETPSEEKKEHRDVKVSDYTSHKSAAEMLSKSANKDWGDDHDNAITAHSLAKEMHRKAHDLAMSDGDTEAAKTHGDAAWEHADQVLAHHRSKAKAIESQPRESVAM